MGRHKKEKQRKPSCKASGSSMVSRLPPLASPVGLLPWWALLSPPIGLKTEAGLGGQQVGFGMPPGEPQVRASLLCLTVSNTCARQAGLRRTQYVHLIAKNWLTKITAFLTKTHGKAIKKSKKWLIQVTLWRKEGRVWGRDTQTASEKNSVLFLQVGSGYENLTKLSNIINIRAEILLGLLTGGTEEDTTAPARSSCHKCVNWNLILRKRQTGSNRGMLYKTPSSTLPKCQGHEGQEKNSSCFRWEVRKEKWQLHTM